MTALRSLLDAFEDSSQATPRQAVVIQCALALFLAVVFTLAALGDGPR